MVANVGFRYTCNLKVLGASIRIVIVIVMTSVFTADGAAIFYSQTDRAGTKEKADVMQSVLSTVAVKATNAEWTNAPDLQEHLHKAVQLLSKDCNMLFVCIMSHDRMGGIMLPIDDLIKQITQDTPRNTRLIILVQACQIVSFADDTGENIDPLTQPVDVNLASPPNGCMRIELTRPDTVLLMASLTEGSAVWGEYTEALAAEISKADGKKHIYDMHTDAVEAMRNEMAMYLVDEIGQIPQYRDTLYGGSIVIPKAIHGKGKDATSGASNA